MRTIAILGASGFIGTRTVETFVLTSEARVRPIVRAASSIARLSMYALDARVADMHDERALTAALAGCDTVIHAAAGSPRDIVSCVRPIYLAAHEAGVERLIYLSSASVHGQAPQPGTNETTPLQLRQPLAYNTAKIRAENQLRRLRGRGRVELVILRPGIVYGPRSSWIGSFADTMLAGSAYLVRGGRGICNAIYVDNLIHAIKLAIRTPSADGEAFLVGDRERITWRDLYEPVASALSFDLDDLPSVEPISITAWHPWVRLLIHSARSRGLPSHLPRRLRRVVASGLSARKETGPRPSPFAGISTKPPTPSLEMSLLQTCDYKLQHDKAERLLGYAPPVSFEEGCRRSVAWLEFAGYPVIDSTRHAPKRGEHAS